MRGGGGGALTRAQTAPARVVRGACPRGAQDSSWRAWGYGEWVEFVRLLRLPCHVVTDSDDFLRVSLFGHWDMTYAMPGALVAGVALLPWPRWRGDVTVAVQ